MDVMNGNPINTNPPVQRNQGESKHFRYEDLTNLVESNGMLKPNGQYIVITPLDKVGSFTASAPFLGWKFNISVRPGDLKVAVELAVRIALQYGLCLQVINSEVMDLPGAQITIFVEEQEKLVMTSKDAEEMMREITQAFDARGIKPGEIPESDAQTIFPCFSMRNDKCKPLLNRNMVGYIPKHVAGNNPNPMRNDPYFFCDLLSDRKPFDPLEHFLSFDADVANSYYRFNDTLHAILSEYTKWDDMNATDQENFVYQYCLGNGANLDKHFLIDAYRENPEILITVQFAFYIAFIVEARPEYLNLPQLVEQYPHDNSFNELMTTIADQSKDRKEVKEEERISLSELLKLSAEKTMEPLPENVLRTIVQKGHPCNAEAARKKLESYCGPKEYSEKLRENVVRTAHNVAPGSPKQARVN